MEINKSLRYTDKQYDGPAFEETGVPTPEHPIWVAVAATLSDNAADVDLSSETEWDAAYEWLSGRLFELVQEDTDLDVQDSSVSDQILSLVDSLVSELAPNARVSD